LTLSPWGLWHRGAVRGDLEQKVKTYGPNTNGKFFGREEVRRWCKSMP